MKKRGKENEKITRVEVVLKRNPESDKVKKIPISITRQDEQVAQKIDIVIYKDVMNKKQTADFLDISISTLDRLIREKKIPYSKINGRVLFIKEDLIKWVKSKRVK